MLSRFLALTLLVLMAGFTACTKTNQTTGQSQVRQAPVPSTTNQQGQVQYGGNTPASSTTNTGAAGGQSNDAELPGTIGPAGVTGGNPQKGSHSSVPGVSPKNRYQSSNTR